MCSGSQVCGGPAGRRSSPLSSSCHQWSRPVRHREVAVARLADPSGDHDVLDRRRCGRRRASAFAFSATGGPCRHPPSAVISTRASASLIRSRSASDEKPPKTTECAAPIRVQASMATGSSGIIGM